MSGHGTSRYGVTCDIEFAANLLIDEDMKKPKKQILAEFGFLLNTINKGWESRIEGFMNEAIKNLETDIRYNKLQLKNVKVIFKICPTDFETI